MTLALRNPLLSRPARALPGRLAVIGAGTIGPDIGYFFKSALPRLELVLLDIDERALTRARSRLDGYVEKGAALGKLTAAQLEGLQWGISYTTDYDVIGDADWVLEAATEDLDLKRRIFARAEQIAPSHALLTSNTSSIPAAHIFAQLERPERATVTHFFAPAHRNAIVEVIDWPKLDRGLLEYLRWVFAYTGKVPLVTRDVVCFMLDRVFDNWCNEAGHLLGVASPAQIDSVAQEFVAAGPFFVLNLANGNPIIVETNSLQAREEGAHYAPVEAFGSRVPWQTVKPGEPVAVPASQAAAIRDRLLGILLSQSLDILDRQIGAPEDLELGARLAFGFKSGPLEHLQSLPEAELARIGARLRQERPGLPYPIRAAEPARRMRRFVVEDDVEGVKLLTIRRPEALNALHDGINDELLEAIRQNIDDPAVRGFVITGYGPRAFSAGADIGRFPQVLGKADAAIRYARDCSRLLEFLDRMDKPVVAALNGMALGGGLELAMRCHGLIATQSAWMQFPEVTLGLVPGIGGMVVPYRRWPHAAHLFHDMLRKAHKLAAATAGEHGILDEVVGSIEDLLPAALRLIAKLTQEGRKISDEAVEIDVVPQMIAESAGMGLSHRTIGIIESAVLQAARCPTLAAALEVGYRAFGECACTPAAHEGITAFTERRLPDFSQTG